MTLDDSLSDIMNFYIAMGAPNGCSEDESRDWETENVLLVKLIYSSKDMHVEAALLGGN